VEVGLPLFAHSIFFSEVGTIIFFFISAIDLLLLFREQLLLFRQSRTEQQSFTTVPRPYD
jgi:hypothetical protein